MRLFHSIEQRMMAVYCVDMSACVCAYVCVAAFLVWQSKQSSYTARDRYM